MLDAKQTATVAVSVGGLALLPVRLAAPGLGPEPGVWRHDVLPLGDV